MRVTSVQVAKAVFGAGSTLCRARAEEGSAVQSVFGLLFFLGFSGLFPDSLERALQLARFSLDRLLLKVELGRGIGHEIFDGGTVKLEIKRTVVL